MIAFWSAALHSRKRLRPQDIVTFSWETGLEALEEAKKNHEGSRGIFPDKLDNG